MERLAVRTSSSTAIADVVDAVHGSPHAELSGVLVRALADVLQQRRIAPEALLGEAADAFFSQPVERRLPLVEYQALIARAIQLTGEPALGLHCGLHAAESSFGLLAPLISHAESLRHAIQLMRQFQPLFFDETRLHLSEQLGTATLRCEFPLARSAVDRSMAELIVAGLVRTLRAFGCARSDIHAVCFEHTTPAYHHEYAIAFAGAERFAQAFTGVEFSASALDRLHIHRRPELHTLLRAEAERSLQQLARAPSCAEQVCAFIRRQRPGQAPQMIQAARALGLSIRSLRRRLLDEGTTFRALAQSVLQEAACAMLRDHNLTLQAIAHALGFTDPTAFHRAFKRWVRLTPAEYRESTARSALNGAMH